MNESYQQSKKRFFKDKGTREVYERLGPELDSILDNLEQTVKLRKTVRR